MEESQASTEKIRILVRVRPLSETEKRKGNRNIIEQNSAKNSLTIWDPLSFDAHKKPGLSSSDANCWARNFSYDHCKTDAIAHFIATKSVADTNLPLF